jgi:hypothetical protein
MTSEIPELSPTAESEATARTLLAAAGLSPSDEETAQLVEQYPLHLAGMNALWAMPETRYAVPALIFNPTPVFVDWS